MNHSQSFLLFLFHLVNNVISIVACVCVCVIFFKFKAVMLLKFSVLLNLSIPQFIQIVHNAIYSSYALLNDGRGAAVAVMTFISMQ